MRTKMIKGICGVLAVMAIAASSVWAAKTKEVVPLAPLTEAGQKLEAKYAEQLQSLKAEIEKALPKIDEQKKADYLKVRGEEKAAEAELAKRQNALNANHGAAGLLEHRKNWVSKSTAALVELEAKLKQASTDDARKAAQEALDKEQKNKATGEDELKKSLEAVEKAKLEEPKLAEDLKVAQDALAKAQANTLKAVNEFGLNAFLVSDKLDAKLAKCVIMNEATPRGLAEYAVQGKEQETLIGKLLSNDALMLQMAIADGANGGQCGKAMEIYTAIQKASDKAGDGVLQKLAAAVAFEHAVPVTQSNPASKTDAPKTVDPVKRYLHYEKAYLAGELDPLFKDLSVWDYRMVVNGDEPDDIITWGREMLRNYRPDEISTADYKWRYVQAVKTEVKYGSADQKYDRPELQSYQNMIMNGGVCGRRAFFGRFILRAFGIPVTARPQPGHAALVHWTPDGWVPNLGAGWGSGSTRTRYDKDLDFLANTQARKIEVPFMQVKRAQWVGSIAGEKPVYGFVSGDPDLWHSVALYKQRQIIEEAKAVALAAVGTDIGEANESKEKEVVKEIVLTAEDKAVVTGKDGTITIPAAACSFPTNSPGKILFMDSNLGGKQMHYSRNGAPVDFEYTVEVPEAGKYALTARVVTTSADQHLLIAANDMKEPTDIAVPFTVGMWDKTPPVEVSLIKGKNVLRFSRGGANIKGLTVKDFTLVQAK